MPHRLPTVPGEQTLLADDDLARSLAPDGRLGGLLAAFAEGAPAGSAVRAATCLAVDPDLVATAAAMRQGYAVRGPERDGARHRRRRRGHLAGHAGGRRARRLRRRTAVRRRGPRRAGPRAARRPRPAGRRRCGGGRRPRPSARRYSMPPPGPAGECSTSRRSPVSPTPVSGRWCWTPRPPTVTRGRPVRSRSPSGRRRCSPCSPTPCSPARRTPRRHRHPRSPAPRPRCPPPRARRWPPRTRPPRSCSAPRPRSNRPARHRSSSLHPTCGARTRRAPERCSPP